ncbi:bifunctional 4-hydroxy-2-oxoglutarate aldolase/2-dehydro-3-deoxy-phosphogluconate aldolase [Sphingomonas agri]|uniref:bifunctional 4-hydroxy-2-oxoglutarate aldolase/2-dehydro-3-deoxy-phosphogluconate aldolase n=1 Tax=Sphingomonas agri TaxID=1813878 RepID=UPI00311FD8A7
MTIDEIMHAAPVIPVLILDQDRDWAAFAETFVGAGLPVLEVTLRTPLAFHAIREMARVPGTIVGAGTVVSERQLGEAIEAGSSFIVSPGITELLGKAVVQSGVPYLPGIATASDIMRGLDLGLERFKFFPAEASGGITALKALAGPFAGSRFCPTGGIRQETAAAWLSLDPVLCVGGTWFVKPGDSLDAIAERARAAAELRG